MKDVEFMYLFNSGAVGIAIRLLNLLYVSSTEGSSNQHITVATLLVLLLGTIGTVLISTSLICSPSSRLFLNVYMGCLVSV